MTFFDYFQIATVLLFLLILFSKVVYLRIFRGINPIAVGAGKNGLELLVELLSFAGLVVWLIAVLLFASRAALPIFPSPLDTMLINSMAAKIAGVALSTLGMVMFMMAYVSFGDSWRMGFDVSKPGPMVTKGVFALTRNPIYLFLDLWFIGIFLINRRLMFLIFAVLAVIAMHWQILQEEVFLAQLYGQPYRNYCARTPRYFGINNSRR